MKEEVKNKSEDISVLFVVTIILIVGFVCCAGWLSDKRIDYGREVHSHFIKVSGAMALAMCAEDSDKIWKARKKGEVLEFEFVSVLTYKDGIYDLVYDGFDWWSFKFDFSDFVKDKEIYKEALEFYNKKKMEEEEEAIKKKQLFLVRLQEFRNRKV